MHTCLHSRPGATTLVAVVLALAQCSCVGVEGLWSSEVPKERLEQASGDELEGHLEEPSGSSEGDGSQYRVETSEDPDVPDMGADAVTDSPPDMDTLVLTEMGRTWTNPTVCEEGDECTEICDNLFDDDGNGLLDCQDVAACQSSLACR